jgi:DNA mismatch repair protein MutS2
MSPNLEKTLVDLEWHRVKAAVASRCIGSAGRAMAFEMPFFATRQEALEVVRQVQEAFDALMRGEALPLHGVRDVSSGLDRLRVGAVLGPTELRDLGSTLGAARVLRRYVSARKEKMNALFRVLSTDPTLDDVEDEITGSFDPDGTLADHASPRLRELRQEYRQSRARLVSRLEELMRKYAAILQDTYFTEREGRYVLPVRTDAHERFPGIVHSTSGSGSTLFLEPRALIPLGNRLKMLEGDVRREEEAVYARLSAMLFEKLPSVLAALDAVGVADLRAATARLTEEASLSFVEVVDEPVVELHAARHPLLVLDGVEVVPSDLRVSGASAVVVSGPNAGGKTVALKAMGLAALMVKAGLPVASGAGSRMGFFDDVLTDVGDDQSLQKNLSTFSAHVQNLARILDQAGPRSLVLLDEVATGTDPREGEALAAAVLDGLCARGAAVVCTTHYEGLKALALADPRFTNASVGFDIATMSPTFHVIFGIPGSSSALAVARRFGVPSLVLERAERFLSREERDFEKMVEKLHDERRALDLARADAERAREVAEERGRELGEEIDRVRQKGEHAVARETEALLAAVRRAREDLRLAQGKLRAKKVEDRELREATRLVDQVASKVAVGGELEPHVRAESFELPAPDALRKGARVYVPRLRAEAEILDVLPGGNLRVSAGALKLSVRADEVRVARPEPVRELPRKETRPAGRPAPMFDEHPIQTSDNTCDLRGLRSDDAIRLAEQFLDRSMSEGRKVAFLVHGHGTGALREAVRGTLANSEYVARLRPGEPREGGEGITLVWLR